MLDSRGDRSGREPASCQNRRPSRAWSVGCRCSSSCSQIRFRRCTKFTPAPKYRSRACCESCTHWNRSEEHTSELQSLRHLVCRLLLEKKKKKKIYKQQI